MRTLRGPVLPALAFVLLSTGCGDGITGPGGREPLALDPGLRVWGHVAMDQLSWSVDGAELYYVTSPGKDPQRIAAVEVRSGALDRWTVVEPWDGCGEVVASPDGRWLYFMKPDEDATPVASGTLYKVAPQGGIPEAVIGNLSTTLYSMLPSGRGSFRLSPDRWARRGPLDQDVRRPGRPLGPGRTPLRLPRVSGPQPLGAATGRRTPLATEGYVGSAPVAGFAGWAPDGGPAVWKTGCVESAGLFTCGETRSALFRFDPAGSRSEVLAVVEGDARLAVFSPDGGRVAYLAGRQGRSRLFVHDVP